MDRREAQMALVDIEGYYDVAERLSGGSSSTEALQAAVRTRVRPTKYVESSGTST